MELSRNEFVESHVSPDAERKSYIASDSRTYEEKMSQLLQKHGELAPVQIISLLKSKNSQRQSITITLNRMHKDGKLNMRKVLARLEGSTQSRHYTLYSLK